MVKYNSTRMVVRVLLFLTIVGLHIIVCCGFDYDDGDSNETIEENFKNNPRLRYNSPTNYDRERDSRDDGRVIFRDYDELNTRYTTQKPRSLQACLLSCERNRNDDPVCGTNGVTYMNIEQLHCAAKCGVDVQFRHFAPCPGWNQPTSTESNDKASCVATCPTTPEYNPVCGTDNVTYKNHGKLMCAQSCGIDVQLKRHYPCPKYRVTSTESSVSTNSPQPSELSRKIKDCIHLCPATSEYSPVCGSDGRTYYNNGKLECARHCGVDVTVYRRSRCTK